MNYFCTQILRHFGDFIANNGQHVCLLYAKFNHLNIYIFGLLMG
jgi:hypothetical protein